MAAEYMKELQFVEYLGDDVKINPIIGKVAGRYPKDYLATDV